jgi:hypothetical protein
MILRTAYVFLFFSLFVSASAQQATYPQSANARILEKSYQILDNLRETTYSLAPRINEPAGIYHTHCSALLTHILDSVAPHALSYLYLETGYDYPRAFSFYQTIIASESNSGSPWKHIASIHEALPGDILAWRVNENIEPNKNTGHVVILMETPKAQPDGSFTCRVFDAASLPHTNDSRPQGTHGVGVGEIRVLTDPSGVPIAYHWSNRQKKPRFKPMAIGRIHLCGSPLHSPSFVGPQCPLAHPPIH